PAGKGFDGDSLVELTDRIAEAARHRLVFLTSRIEGELVFEVRGLQEYMAAECMMSGEPGLVLRRLRAIASSPYWRNVFHFAAGKCFFDTQSRHYQDALRVMCEDLNMPTDPLMSAIHAGSELGLTILESGAPSKNPNHIRHLARIALELLACPDI